MAEVVAGTPGERSRRLALQLREVSRMYEQKRIDAQESLARVHQSPECSFSPRTNHTASLERRRRTQTVTASNSSPVSTPRAVPPRPRAKSTGAKPTVRYHVPDALEPTAEEGATVYERLYSQADKLRRSKERQMLRSRVKRHEMETEALEALRRARARTRAASAAGEPKFDSAHARPLYEPVVFADRERELQKIRDRASLQGCTFKPDICSRSRDIATHAPSRLRAASAHESVHARLYAQSAATDTRRRRRRSSANNSYAAMSAPPVPNSTSEQPVREVRIRLHLGHRARAGNGSGDENDDSESDRAPPEPVTPPLWDGLSSSEDPGSAQDLFRGFDSAVDGTAFAELSDQEESKVDEEHEYASAKRTVKQPPSAIDNRDSEVPPSPPASAASSTPSAWELLKLYGANVEKHGRRGRPHFCRVTADDRAFFWTSKQGGTRRVPWETVSCVVRGRRRESGGAGAEGVLLTVQCAARDLVLGAHDEAQRDMLCAALEQGRRAHLLCADDDAMPPGIPMRTGAPPPPGPPLHLP